MPTITGNYGQISNNKDHNLWGPIVKLSIYTYPSPMGTPIRPLRDDVVALIDTGAQLCSIDTELSVELGLKQGAGTAFVQLGHMVSAPSYFATLHFPQFGYSYSADLMGSPFKGGDVPFRAIVGLDFLRRFELSLSRKRDIVRLDWVGD
jgi:hypothetical protein